MGRATVKKQVVEAAHALASKGEPIRVASVARLAGATRQTAAVHLHALVKDGVLTAEGQGRALRFTFVDRAWSRTYELRGLEEDRVWRQLEHECPLIQRLSDRAAEIAHFAFTELMNNAIDHSNGRTARASADERQGKFSFVIEDDGEGAFEHVRRIQGLTSPLDALQDLTKGKVTTDPARHTGQGIFFSSRALDRFILEANGLMLLMDNAIEDVAWGESARTVGTSVRGEISFDSQRELKAVFDAFSGEDFAFTRSRTWIKLFETGLGFVSRSEAKRLLTGLERFEEVTLDFQGVSAVGQGFADEVFRVWKTAHPNTQLVPTNMSPPVERMVQRARGS